MYHISLRWTINHHFINLNHKRLKYYYKRPMNFPNSWSFIYFFHICKILILIALILVLHMFLYTIYASNFTCIPSRSLNRSQHLGHSSFRYTLTRPRIPATNRSTNNYLNKTTDKSLWHIIPSDQLNDLINILLHTTFTLRFSSCCRDGFAKGLHFHPLKANPSISIFPLLSPPRRVRASFSCFRVIFEIR